MAKFCSNCGNQLNENQAYCSNCGVSIEGKKNDKNSNKKIYPIIAIAVVAIVIVAVVAVLVLSNDKTPKYYKNLEIDLREAAREYVNTRHVIVTVRQSFSYKKIKDAGFTNKLVDENGKECTGYVMVNVIDNVYEYTPYISCENYTTPNYNKPIQSSEKTNN